MKFLVTGGCGFIGSHLCRALTSRGDDVVILDDLSSGKRDNLVAGAQLIVGNTADPACVDKAIAGADGVFHLAAISSVQRCNEAWRDGHLANQTGSVTVFEAAKQHGRVPVVFASSAAIYGDAGAGPIAETRVPAPQTAYGVDKYGSELHARLAQNLHGVRTVGLRPFNVFGPGQDPKSPYSGVISIFATRLQNGQALDVFGDGLQSRDYIYVADVVRFFLAAMALENTSPMVFNVATGRATTLLELIEILGDTLQTTPRLRHTQARAGDIRDSCGCTEMSRNTLNLTAQVSLEDGLAMTFGAARHKRRTM